MLLLLVLSATAHADNITDITTTTATVTVSATTDDITAIIITTATCHPHESQHFSLLRCPTLTRRIITPVGITGGREQKE